MSDLLEAFKEYLVIIKSLASNSVEAYINDINDYEIFLNKNKKNILEASNEEIISYLSTIKNPRTRNRHLSTINSFYNFCFESYDNIKKPNISFAKLPKTLPKYLDNKTIMDSLNLINRSNITGARDYALILFLYATGVRVSEAVNLKKEDIDPSWVKVTFAKGSKQRVVPIAKIAYNALNDYLGERTKKSEYLFLNYQGKPLSRISIFKICKKYCNVSPHVFRHSYATSLILGGADLMVVSELLGHSNIETTQIYTHIQQKHLSETIKSCHPLSGKDI